ncbi:MAG: hypothetical protein R3B99_30230 [Polyangiales bacterium]
MRVLVEDVDVPVLDPRHLVRRKTRDDVLVVLEAMGSLGESPVQVAEVLTGAGDPKVTTPATHVHVTQVHGVDLRHRAAEAVTREPNLERTVLSPLLTNHVRERRSERHDRLAKPACAPRRRPAR